MEFPNEPMSGAVLAAVVQPASERLARLHAGVDAHLHRLLPQPCDASDSLALAMHAAVLSPGKRLRPLLMLATASSLRVDPVPLIDAACALELVHAASLALDDLPCMDDAQTRRGRPSLHRQFGQDVAVLASVALLSLAFRTLATTPGLGPGVRSRLIVALSDAVGAEGLVRGQFRDLHATAARIDAGHAGHTNELKTGALIRAAFQFAALTADASGIGTALESCAWHVGQAFQLLDDLKDMRLVPVDGKDVDQDAGKQTLLTLLQPAAAHRALRTHVRGSELQLRRCLPDDDLVAALLAAIFGPALSCEASVQRQTV